MSLTSNYFRFGDHASTDFSLYISGDTVFDSPARDYESVKVLGRNGKLIVDRGRFENYTVKYPVFAIGDFRRKAESVRQWLLEKTGYQNLSDTYNPDEYRKAIYSGSVDFDVSALCQAGKATLTFEVCPQRFLNSGKTYINLTKSENTVLTNPTAFDARPFIYVHGTGSGVITIGNKSITITNNNKAHFYIDCESQETYTDGSYNLNSKVSYMDSFPVLPSGNTGCTYTGDFDVVKIMPRWWRV